MRLKESGLFPLEITVITIQAAVMEDVPWTSVTKIDLPDQFLGVTFPTS